MKGKVEATKYTFHQLKEQAGITEDRDRCALDLGEGEGIKPKPEVRRAAAGDTALGCTLLPSKGQIHGIGTEAWAHC